MARYKIKTVLKTQYAAYFYRKQNVLDDEYVFYDMAYYAYKDFGSFDRFLKKLNHTMNQNCITRFKILPDFRGNVICDNSASQAQQLNLF